MNKAIFFQCIKTILKFLLSIIVYMVVSGLINSIMPFSREYKELVSSASPGSLLFVLIYAGWICFTIYFLIKHACFTGAALITAILFVMFFISSFMIQLETLLFGFAFPVLTKADVLLLILGALVPLLVTVPLMVALFRNKKPAAASRKINIKVTAIKIGVLGIIYLSVYWIFGYFIAWQFEEVQIFYSKIYDELSSFVMLPFQVLRGILFGIFIVPLIAMINKKIPFITSVCLVYLCTAVPLVMPNPLFPDTVRIAHLIEMSGSMLLFGMVSGIILWGKKSPHGRN